MKKLLLSIATIACAASAWALDVNCTAGSLASLVTDKNVTSLTVTGTIDVRDFEFINAELTKLKTLNLAKASIVANSRTTDIGIVAHKANVVPAFALFGATSLTTVSLPASASVIGESALAGCTALSRITLPTALDSIGPSAFNSCSSLTAISLPSRLKAIATGAFARSGLKSLTLNPATGMAVPDRLCLDCKQLATVSLGSRVSAIGDDAFAGCVALKQPTVSTALTSIGNHAFEGSGVTSLNFVASGIGAIGDWAFASTPLTTAAVPAAAEIGEGILFNATKLVTVTIPLADIPAYTLAGDSQVNLSNVLADRAKTIGDYAFYNNTATHEFNIPAGVTRIGTRAMAGMTGLRTVNAKPLTVPALGDNVWEGVAQAGVRLNVEEAAEADYMNTAQWREFYIQSGGLVGDVNLDGYINVGDIAAIYGVILQIDMTNEPRADINDDGMVNVGDVSAEYILITTAGNNVPRHLYMAKLGNNDDAMSAAAIDVEQGQVATIDLRLDNTADYNAFQLDITLPQGLELVGVETTDRSRALQMASSEIRDGVTRVVAAAPENALTAGNGTMLRIHVTANHNFTGNDIITIDDILLVEKDVTCHYLDQVTVAATGTTGISDISTDNDPDAPVDVYNLQGQLLRRGVARSNATQGLPTGIYLVGDKKVRVD